MHGRHVARLAGIGAMLAAPTASADDLYVDASAAPGGDGSQSSPFVVLQDGIDAAMAGDVVHALPGTYDSIQSVRDGSDSARIEIRGEPSRMAVVLSDGRALDLAHTHHTFAGLVLDAGYGSGDGVRADGGNDAEFRDMEVRRSTGDCIDLRDASNVLIVDSEIHHCVGQPNSMGEIADAHGVTGDSVFDLTISNTEIYLTTGDSFQLSPSRSAWDNVTIEGCTLWTGMLDEDAGMLSAGTVIGENAVDTKVDPGILNGSGQRPRLVITDVTTYGWHDYIGNQGAFNLKENVDAVVDRVAVMDSEIAFRLRGPALVRVQNAVIHDTQKAFRLEDAIEDALLLNNTVGPTSMETIEDGGGGDPVNLTIQNVLFLADAVPAMAAGDPSNMAVTAAEFADAPGGDYHLLPDSTPVDAGIDLSQVTVDRDGVARPVGDAYDVGAYEWTDEPPPGTETGDGDGGDDGTGSGDGADGGDDGGTGASGDGGATGGGGTGSTGGEDDAGNDGDSGDADGCGCDVGARDAGPLAAWALLPLARRRRRV